MQDILNGQCRARAYQNYCSKPNGFQLWKEDGERFMQANFIHSPEFPIINDGKIELDEWLQEIKVTDCFYLFWEPYESYIGIMQFVKKLLRFYKKQKKAALKSYIKEFSNIIKNIQWVIIEQCPEWLVECNEEEEEEEEEIEYKDEGTQTDNA